MTITGGSALSKQDIDRMVADAERYAEEDRQRREAVDVRNSADGAVYSTEKFLSENADKIPDEVKAEVEGDIATVKKALETDDTEEIRSAAGKLSASSQKMGAAMYEAAGAADAAAAASAEGTADGAASEQDDVVDAEIVDEGNDTPPAGDEAK
jgi:molecular chaperone DnaK